MTPSLIYYAPTEPGGLNEYAARQVQALASQGQAVCCVASTELIRKLSSLNVDCEVIELEPEKIRRSKPRRAITRISSLRKNIRLLADTIDRTACKSVLFTSYAEYFSPFWVGALQRRSKQGVRFGVVAHDPIRDFKLGPQWWHNRSVSLAYSFVDVAFVHENIQLDTGYPTRAVETIVIPHGQYEFPDPDPKMIKADLRKSLDIPESAIALLAFGHIRDGKNLHLAIGALRSNARLHLLVAGSLQSSSQKPVEFYRQVARDAGVESRCHFHEKFIAEDQAWRYFAASDYALLTYSSDFRSASGVLSSAVQFKLPVLGSSGAGPLKSALQKYNLGVWVEPDSQASLEVGLQQLLADPIKPLWEQFSQDNSWGRNAEIVTESFGIGK